MRPVLDRQLMEVRDSLVRLSSMTAQAIQQGIKAFVGRDVALAKSVIADDKAVNALRFSIEEVCYRLIALQQPNATNLRIIVGSVSVATNLERIADHAAGVARLGWRLAELPPLPTSTAISQMANISEWMVRNAVTCFVQQNITLVESVVARDKEIDKIHEHFCKEVISRMQQSPDAVERGTFHLWASHNFERIGDRAMNICERAVYVVTGELREF
jgi:phosphate transport system protein